MPLPLLYSFRRCPYAMRARMALLVAGVRVEMREVALGDKPAELRAASAKATVPVLVTGTGVIEESIDIMRWALGGNDPEGWLAGDDPGLIAGCDGEFKRRLDGYKYGVPGDPATLAQRAGGQDYLQRLEDRLAGAANLCRADRGLADLAIMPFVRQFAAVDRDWFDALPLPGVQGWLARHLESPLFAAAMVKLPRWRAGDAARSFPD